MRALHTVIFATCVAGIILLSGCESDTSDENASGKQVMTDTDIRDVLKEHRDELMSVKGVVGTGIGKCGEELCIRVMVTKKTPRLGKSIPSSLGSYRVDIIETGGFKAQPEDN